jgi:hypothetical protein
MAKREETPGRGYEPITVAGGFRRDAASGPVPDDPGPSDDIPFAGPPRSGRITQSVAIIAAIVAIGISDEIPENAHWLIMAAQGALGVALGLIWRNRGR